MNFHQKSLWQSLNKSFCLDFRYPDLFLIFAQHELSTGMWEWAIAKLQAVISGTIYNKFKEHAGKWGLMRKGNHNGLPPTFG